MTSLLIDSQSVDGWVLENAFGGAVRLRSGWSWSAQRVRGTLGLVVAPGSEYPYVTVRYTGGYLLPGDNLSSATLSLLAADNSVNDSAGLLPLLVAGDRVTLAGFGLVGNNGQAVIVTRTASKLTLSGLTLTNESAGSHLLTTGTTFAINATARTLTDSAAGLGTLLPGSTIQLSGFVDADNNGPVTVTAVTPTVCTLGPALLLEDEAAGATVTVRLLHPSPATLTVRTLPHDVEMACIELVRAWYLQRAFDLTGPRVVQTDAGTAVLSAPSGALPKATVELLKAWRRIV